MFDFILNISRDSWKVLAGDGGDFSCNFRKTILTTK
jgi:hypothetical protein